MKNLLSLTIVSVLTLFSCVFAINKPVLSGVGCMVNYCGKCDFCKAGLEQYCKEVVLTYHYKDQFRNNETIEGS